MDWGKGSWPFAKALCPVCVLEVEQQVVELMLI